MKFKLLNQLYTQLTCLLRQEYACYWPPDALIYWVSNGHGKWNLKEEKLSKEESLQGFENKRKEVLAASMSKKSRVLKDSEFVVTATISPKEMERLKAEKMQIRAIRLIKEQNDKLAQTTGELKTLIEGQ